MNYSELREGDAVYRLTANHNLFKSPQNPLGMWSVRGTILPPNPYYGGFGLRVGVETNIPGDEYFHPLTGISLKGIAYGWLEVKTGHRKWNND